MKKTTIQEELARYNAINKYGNVLYEQAAPVTPPPPPAAGTDPMNVPPPPAGDLGAGAPPPVAGADPNAIPPAPPTGEEEKPEPTDANPAADDTTEDIDVTELVNMTKSIKKELEDSKGEDSGVIQKMDDVFTKLGELENKLGEMGNIITKIDELGAKIEEVKPKTPVEKLEMRSLDSYPFNEKPDQFFSEKLPQMKETGKNEYVLTKGDVENYGKNEVMKSFNPNIPDNY